MFSAKTKKPTAKLRYSVKGKQIKFFDAQGVDELVSITLTLAQELWVVKERLAVMEAITHKKGIVLADEIENFEFTSEQRAAVEDEKRSFIDRIYFTLREQAEALETDSRLEPAAPKVP
ncbi:MAG: hypothetical protein FJX59_04110 [Alphaproteobacteria bacterium]|nr:hypothetical protein [Alphaproteobacteria bacterium]